MRGLAIAASLVSYHGGLGRHGAGAPDRGYSRVFRNHEDAGQGHSAGPAFESGVRHHHCRM